MNDLSPLAHYLRTRRSLLQPDQVGLPDTGRRRVPGLRREEVAELAGISADYYLRIEQGREPRPSDQVLLALATALQLDEQQRTYLLRLARPQPHPLKAYDRPVPSGLVTLLDRWSHSPAYVFDRNLDILASNRLMRAIAPGMVEPGTNFVETTTASYTQALTGDPSAEELSWWNATLGDTIAALRFYSDSEDPRLQEVVGTLSMRSRLFRTVWARHEARPFTSGVNPVEVGPLGWIDFRWQALELAVTPGQYMVVLLAEPGSPAAAAVAYLASQAGEHAPSSDAPTVREPVLDEQG